MLLTFAFCLLVAPIWAADLNSALKSKQLSSALDPDAARIRLQVNYAMTMGWQTLNYLTVYWAQQQHLPNEAAFLSFTHALLQQNQDPFVKAVYYIPAQALIIEMHNAATVETVLRSGLFLYRLDTLSWVFNPVAGENKAIRLGVASSFSVKITPYFLDALHSMSIITDYCLSPQGYSAPNGQLNDIAWCPLWHLYVMPP